MEKLNDFVRSSPVRTAVGWLLTVLVAASAARYVYRNVVLPLRDLDSDFIAFYCGADAVLHGENPYDPAVRSDCFRHNSALYGDWITSYEANIALMREAGREHTGVLEPQPYLNPPQYAYLLVPLALLPVELASLCWLALNHVWYLGGLLLLWKAFRPRVSLPAAALIVCAALNSITAYGFFVRHQSSGLLFFSLAVALAAFHDGRDGSAAVMMFLSLIVKPYVGAPLCLLWWAWGRRRLVYLVAALVVISTILCVMGIGLPALEDYLFHEIPTAFAEQTETFTETNIITPSLFALTARYMPGQRDAARVVALLLSGGVVLATVLVLRRGRSSGPSSLHAMGLVICAAVLVAPYNRVYDMLILWIPIFFLLADWKSWAAESRIAIGGLAAVLLAFTFSFHATVYTMVCGCLWLLEVAAINHEWESRIPGMKWFVTFLR